MLNIAYDPIYAHPLPAGHRFPMLKYELIPAQLLHEGTITESSLFSPDAAAEEDVLRTHASGYWQQLRTLSLPSREVRRIGFPLSATLVDRELRIAGGTIEGCLRALPGGIALNVAGGTHHAGSNWGEGFCLLNDQAIAANFLLQRGLVGSVLMIDLDVHQGNGTAELFENESRVFTFSMHAAHNFPYRKERSDLDLALPDGTGDAEYLCLLAEHLPQLLENCKPEFVFYLSGVDVLETDKLGRLALSRKACRERDRIVLELCRRRGIPVQVSMGGGYSPDIRDIVEAHCNTFRVASDLYC